ncbi:ABC transporter ATP-binding protein [Paenibacillus woosongensis]|uniref:ABC transporter ATP-binding protein n=1 Tax=Paenibacillus woosongensis TaxID=307580 RepID=A0AA95I4K3_9BACL|nr:ABC transporter ATP-binding protein [Paenibacillus woosongensis]WHX49725.1 ABC transporter ATP-binding protein [Paenibacillus woosongensis]
MATILSFIKKYRIAAMSAICMMLIELFVELIQPLLISRIIDDGISKQDLSVVWLWGGVLVVSALLAFAAGLASSFFASHASQGFGYDLRDKLYDKVQSFSYAVFSRFPTSSLITRLTGDITQLQEMVFMSLRFATRVPLVVTGSVIMALVVNVKLGLLLTVTAPVLAVFIMWMMKKTSLLFRAVQQRMDTVNGVIQENLTGMRLIRVFVRVAHEMKRFEQRSRELMQGTVSALRLTETTMPLMLLMMNGGIIAILWFGRLDIASGLATTGEVVAVLNYSLRTIGALSALSWIISSYSRAAASGQRVVEVLRTEEEEGSAVAEAMVTDKAGHAREDREAHGARRPSQQAGAADKNLLPIQGEVQFDEVSFSYPASDIRVLQEISFEAKPGQRIAIMGATGSGKSSLVQLIPRLHEATGGTIRIDGRDIRQMEPEQLRGAIGYVPQEVMLFSGSVRDNIAWGREDASMEQIVKAAKQAQIHETIKRLPHGYDTMLGQRGVNLSGGQKQRLSIARALVRRPAILILDDSTSALDVRTEAALLEELTRLSCTTFLITQKISSTTSADLIMLLDEGRLIAKGSHEELMAESSLYRRIYESQYGEASQHAQNLR